MLLKKLFTHCSLFLQMKNFSIELFLLCLLSTCWKIPTKQTHTEREREEERQLPGAIGLAQIYRFLLVCIDFRVVGRNFQFLTMDNARAQWTNAKVVNKCFKTYSRSIQNELVKQIRISSHVAKYRDKCPWPTLQK